MNDWNGIKEFLVDKIRFNKSWKSIIFLKLLIHFGVERQQFFWCN